MSQFAFLQHDWRPVFDAASRAEDALPADPRAACFYARRALELAMAWAYKYDPALRLPFLDTLNALIGEPSFKALAGEVVVSKTRLIATLGNRADHSHRAIPADAAVLALRELFHVGYWFARSYGRAVSPSPDLHFDPAIATPHAARSHREGVESLQQLEAELRGRDESLAGLFAGTVALDAELKRKRDEVAAARQAAALQPDRHDYEEAGTRDRVIDLLLEEAGWPMDRPRDREFKVDDGPGGKQVCVDLVFWGDDGKPLGLVETRRTRHDRSEGQRQAGLCADYLERAFGQRPVIFQSSGCRHWLWDEALQPPREVQGFYRKAELLRLIQRRAERRPLGAAEIRRAIVGRFYQTRCIRRVAEAFEREHRREALLTMASGTGKTRSVIALCDLLLRRNWVRQVLFLADGAVLVNQVVASFKRHMPDATTVNLIADKYGEGQIFVSTHAAMMGLIESTRDIQLRFGVGHFDLVVVHEAHPSVFRKYRAIFDHFDALLVGLTATPEAAVEHETYARFDLDDGAPTDGCSAEEAARDGFLVPPRAVPAPFRFLREELGYQELSEDERDRWDALEWDEDREVADRVERESHRRALFDRDNVDSVLTHLMRHGIRVAGGDRLGKTIVFAQNQAHARFIAERFQANFPQYGGEFARAITLATAQTQNLVEHFSRKAAAPHLAISADALDIGVDIPEVVNLVFFRPVHSRSRFHQMMGRAARPCPDLFAPGKHKRCFHVFDCCHNLEYFDHPVPEMADAGTESLGKRLFTARLELIGALDHATGGAAVSAAAGIDRGEPKTDADVRRLTGELLHAEVAAMNVDDMVVRPHRSIVEKYALPEAWTALSAGAVAELSREVAGLPSTFGPQPEDARRFDLLIVHLQLGLLRAEPESGRVRDQMRQIAALLEERSASPLVRLQMALVGQVQTEAWWQDVTIWKLETVRRRLRDLVTLIDVRQRRPLYLEFEDGTDAGDEDAS